ncbi:MAG: DUF4230 domain-containing protein [Prevotella sp.]|nr:DUF4230 domain-containing protein [Prevotella sp.]
MTIKSLFLYVLLLALLSSCSGNNKEKEGANTLDTIPMMVTQIQRCSKLYAAEYHVRKIITHDDQLKLDGTFMQQDFSIDLPLGKRKVAIPLDATIKAYVDFGEFSKGNVIRKGNKIELILPDPQVTLTSTRIRHDEVKRYVALTRRNFSDEELTSYERQGRQAIIKDIPRMGIVETARENAARTLIPIITQMGFEEKDITITFRKDFSIENLLKELTSNKE